MRILFNLSTGTKADLKCIYFTFYIRAIHRLQILFKLIKVLYTVKFRATENDKKNLETANIYMTNLHKV